ncbi:hypothetical protein [Butyrivibrio sp. WCD3002]|uniref:hypothetical protein n=1 Tax=Butyrivibrio sp. WCD3002 TaxID=1280676 RepID=UPI000417E39B|nr:hypothetical protein [Butyrivibrio sp. WCD3002]
MPVTQNDIFEFLEKANIKHDDIVTIHCSLKSIGEIEGGADGYQAAAWFHCSYERKQLI